MFQFLFIILLNLLCTAPVIWSLTALVGGAALHNSRLQHSLQQLVSAVTLASVSSVTDVPSLGAWPLSLRQPEAQLTGPGRWSTSMWNSERFSLKHLNFVQINHRAISFRVCKSHEKSHICHMNKPLTYKYINSFFTLILFLIIFHIFLAWK